MIFAQFYLSGNFDSDFVENFINNCGFLFLVVGIGQDVVQSVVHWNYVSNNFTHTYVKTRNSKIGNVEYFVLSNVLFIGHDFIVSSNYYLRKLVYLRIVKTLVHYIQTNLSWCCYLIMLENDLNVHNLFQLSFVKLKDTPVTGKFSSRIRDNFGLAEIC